MANNQNNNINGKIFSLALPMAFMQLIVMGSSFLCMVMLAKLGHSVLAASALIFSTQTSVMVIGMSLLFSLSILIGHAYGAEQYSTIGCLLRQSWILGLLLSVPIIIIFWNIDRILLMLGQHPELCKILKDYFHIYVWAVVPILLAVCNQQLCYGTHNQKIVIISAILEVLLLLIIAYALVFGKFGLLKLGVIGLAYAIVAQGWFYWLFTTGYFYFSARFEQYAIFNSKFNYDGEIIRKLTSVGWPMSAQISGEMLSMFVGAAMVGWLGLQALAAYQVVIQYLFLIIVPIFALSQASSILIGQAYGAKQFSDIRQIGTTGLNIGIIISLIAGLVFCYWPSLLAAAYIDVPANKALMQLIGALFMIMAVSQFFDSIRNVIAGALRGLLDTKFPMYISLGSIWLIGLPMSYLLGIVFQYGVIGIAIGTVIGMLVGAICLFYRWQQKCFLLKNL